MSRDEGQGPDDLFETKDARQLLRDLTENPAEHIETLRSELPLAVDIARADSLGQLRSWFTERSGWQAHRERSGPLGESYAGVEWSYGGVHETDGSFNGLRASGRDVTVHAFTIMGAERERFEIRRYVDWAGLFAQLGLTLNWRIPLTQPDEDSTGGR